MKTTDAFMPYLMPLVRGCPEPMASDALVEAAINFCEHTDLVQITTEPVILRTGNTIDVDLPSDQVVSRVLDVWADLRHLQVVPTVGMTSPLAFFDEVGENRAREGQPTHAMLREPNTLTVAPSVDRPYTMTARVSLRPKRTARQLADVLFDDWANAICYGAAALLAAIPGTSFGSPDTVALGSARFTEAMGRARIEATKGKTRADIRVRMRAWP